MDAPNPPKMPSSVAPVESTTIANPAARSAAATQLAPRAMADSSKRKRLGSHVVAASSSAAPLPAAPKGKVSAKKADAKKMACTKKAPVRKKASFAALTAASTPAPAAAADLSLDRDSPRLVEDESFVDMLNSGTIDIDMAPLGEDYDEATVDYEIWAGDGTDEACGEDVTQNEGVTQEDVVGVLLDGAASAKNKSIRTTNYNELEDATLIKAWESVSILH